jgi:drug/metabolite transporter (DMT)-like permease
MAVSETVPFFARGDTYIVSLRLKAHLALSLCALFWGVTFVVVKDALTDSSVFAYLAARFTLAILPLAWFYRADLPKLSAADFWAGVRIGILMFGGYAF